MYWFGLVTDIEARRISFTQVASKGRLSGVGVAVGVGVMPNTVGIDVEDVGRGVEVVLTNSCLVGVLRCVWVGMISVGDGDKEDVSEMSCLRVGVTVTVGKPTTELSLVGVTAEFC